MVLWIACRGSRPVRQVTSYWPQRQQLYIKQDRLHAGCTPRSLWLPLLAISRITRLRCQARSAKVASLDHRREEARLYLQALQGPSTVHLYSSAPYPLLRINRCQALLPGCLQASVRATSTTYRMTGVKASRMPPSVQPPVQRCVRPVTPPVLGLSTRYRCQ